MLEARSVVARSEVLAAELAGSSFPLVELAGDECTGDQLPEAVRRAARRANATDVVLLTARAGGKVLGSLTLFRSRRAFAPGEMVAARFAASHLGLVLRAFLGVNGAAADSASFARALSLAGDALAVGLEKARAADEIVRISVRASGAEAAALWYPGLEGSLEPLASVGRVDGKPPQERAGSAGRARAGAARARRRRARPDRCELHPRPAAGRRSRARVSDGDEPVGGGARPARHVRRPGSPGSARRRAGARDVARAGTLGGVAGRRRPGDGRAFARPHAGDRRRARVRAAGLGTRGGVPAPGNETEA